MDDFTSSVTTDLFLLTGEIQVKEKAHITMLILLFQKLVLLAYANESLHKYNNMQSKY